VRNHLDLAVWHRARRVALSTYELTRSFPREERFGLVAQMRRAAVSVVSNIAEGAARRSDREFTRHLDIALASAAELETQLDIAGALGFIDEASTTDVSQDVIEVKKMLSGLIGAIGRRLP
jgi:four helix bundle protein